MSKRSRGTTIPELLVASSILLFLTAACGTALRASMQYHQRIEQQSKIEEDLLKTIGSLSRELGESSMKGVVWQATPIALTFPTPRNADGTLLIDHAAGNRIRWQTVLSYRVEGTENELKRYIDRLPSPEIAPPNALDMTPPRDDAYFADPGREFKVLATGVTDFTVTAVAIDDFDESQTVVTDFDEANLLRVFMRIEQGEDRKYAISSEVEVVPSN